MIAGCWLLAAPVIYWIFVACVRVCVSRRAGGRCGNEIIRAAAAATMVSAASRTCVGAFGRDARRCRWYGRRRRDGSSGRGLTDGRGIEAVTSDGRSKWRSWAERAVVGARCCRKDVNAWHSTATAGRVAFSSRLVSRRVCIDCVHVKRALGRRRRPTDRRTGGWRRLANEVSEPGVASHRVGQQLYSQLIMPAIDQRRDLAGGRERADADRQSLVGWMLAARVAWCQIVLINWRQQMLYNGGRLAGRLPSVTASAPPPPLSVTYCACLLLAADFLSDASCNISAMNRCVQVDEYMYKYINSFGSFHPKKAVSDMTCGVFVGTLNLTRHQLAMYTSSSWAFSHTKRYQLVCPACCTNLEQYASSSSVHIKRIYIMTINVNTFWQKLKPIYFGSRIRIILCSLFVAVLDMVVQQLST